MPGLTDRFKTALDVSGAFDNCFFHTYAIHLLANKQALPGDLFDFESIGGSNSPASILQQQFKNDRTLSLFEKQHRYKHPDTPVPFFLVEKTLVLGILLREWFATEMFKKSEHLALKMLDKDDYDVIDSFKGYLEFREAGLEKENLANTQKGTIYKANEDFLEYIILRKSPTFTASQEKPEFEKFLADVDINTALRKFWLEVGYTNYCLYMAELNAQVTSADIARVVEENLEQPLTIYDQTTAHLIYNNNGSVTHPKMEIALNVKEYHFKLLKTEQTTSLLDEYNESYQQYKKDREAIIRHSRAEEKIAAAKEQSSIFAGAICKEEQLNTKPFKLLKAKVDELQTFVKETEEAMALDEQRQAREAEQERRRSPSPMQIIEANNVDGREPVLAGIQPVVVHKDPRRGRGGLENSPPPVELPEVIELVEEEHSSDHDKHKAKASPVPVQKIATIEGNSNPKENAKDKEERAAKPHPRTQKPKLKESPAKEKVVQSEPVVKQREPQTKPIQKKSPIKEVVAHHNAPVVVQRPPRVKTVKVKPKEEPPVTHVVEHRPPVIQQAQPPHVQPKVEIVEPKPNILIVPDSLPGVIVPDVQSTPVKPSPDQHAPEKQLFPEIADSAQRQAEFEKHLNALELQVNNLRTRVDVEAKRDKVSDDYQKLKASYDITENIHSIIKDAGKAYFDRSISYREFKSLVNDTANNEKTRPILEQHRGIKKVLEDIINFLPRLINSLFGSKITLFKLNTKSVNKVDALTESVNKAGPNA